MIKKSTMEFCVGLFIIVGTISFAVLFFKVSGVDDVKFDNGYYTVTAQFSNVGSLKSRSKVIISGVTVGRVSKIEFDKADFTARVTMKLDKRIDNLPVDSEAKIVTAGLLGDKYITLVTGFESEEFLSDGSHIPVEQTDSALVLEDLIGKFFAGKASQ